MSEKRKRNYIVIAYTILEFIYFGIGASLFVSLFLIITTPLVNSDDLLFIGITITIIGLTLLHAFNKLICNLGKKIVLQNEKKDV